MKKIILFFALMMFIFPVFSGATPEETKDIIQNLPSYVEQKHGVVSSSFASSGSSSSSTGNSIIERDMAQLERLYKYVEKNYLYDIDYNSVYHAMANALLESLNDKYSYYVAPEDSKDYEEQAMGKYGGIGIYFLTNMYEEKTDEGQIINGFQVSQVFPNTPAAKMGMMAKDVIIAVDGEPASEMTSNECASKMKGDVGSNVTLTIFRNGSSFDITLTREIIYTPTVEYEMIDEENAYLSILEFSADTASKIEQALKDLSSQGMKGLIIDLRNNPGGDVDITLDIADMFIRDNVLLKVYHKDSSKNVVYQASSSTIVDPNVKVVILINEGSASSSEIFCSTMRDNGRAVLVGATSYGKGVMQLVTSFGESYISVTSAEFVPPSDNPIHEQGVKPDYPVESIILNEDEIESYREFIKSGVAEEHIKQFPDCTPGNIRWFVNRNRNTGLRDEVLQIVLRNTYYAQGKDNIKTDIEFDPQLNKAYQLLIEKK